MRLELKQVPNSTSYSPPFLHHFPFARRHPYTYIYIYTLYQTVLCNSFTTTSLYHLYLRSHCYPKDTINIYIYIPPNEASPSESRIPLATPPSKIIVRLLYRVFCKSSRGVMIRLTAEGRIKPRRGSREDAYEPALSLSLSLSLSRLPNSQHTCTNSTATHDPSSDARRLFTAAIALKPTPDHTWILLTTTVNTHRCRHAIATRLSSHLFLFRFPPPPLLPSTYPRRVRRQTVDLRLEGRPLPSPLFPRPRPNSKNTFFPRGGSEGSPVATGWTITSSMGRMVVVDPWRGDTRGDTRLFADLLDDGVHATTSNAHGPAAFSPRTRCRSASRREMMVRPGVVSSPTHAPSYPLRVTRRGRVTRRPLLLDALENRLALSAGTGRQ